MISECLLSSGECDEKYVLVDDILSASDYYEALGLSSDTTTDEIRRAYIRKSLICHPDKFVPPYPRATQSFQLLSTAYNTLIQPSSRLNYDMNRKSYHLSHCTYENNAVDIFEQVIRQLYIEIMEGEFQTLRTVIHAMNETNRILQISDEVLEIAEVGFLKIRDIVLTSQKYYGIVQFELLRLYELQDEIRNLSYFDVWRRMKLSLILAKVLIQIPLTINNAIKKEDQLEGRYGSGLLGRQIEYGLERAIGSLNEPYSTY
ncbi:unnamed protein product [Mucor hiemalis]